MFVQIEQRDPGTVEVHAYDRLPHVPQWIQISLNPTKKPFWTIPDDHPFEISKAKHGLPQELLAAARRYGAGEIDQVTAEALILELLTAWSRQYESGTDSLDASS